MQDERPSHKLRLGAIAQWAKTQWLAQAAARRAHAIAVWGDEPDAAAWQPRPDYLYRRVRTAWSPKA